MLRNDSTVLVLTNQIKDYCDWEGTAENCCTLIRVRNLSLLKAALEGGVAEFSRDVSAVIFDSAVEPAQLLEFLAGLPLAYRGEVLAIQSTRDGFLSAAARSEGRLLYKLSAEDIEFYIAARFGTVLPCKMAHPFLSASENEAAGDRLRHASVFTA